MDRQVALQWWRGLTVVLGFSAVGLLWYTTTPARHRRPAESAQALNLADSILSARLPIAPAHDAQTLPAPALLHVPDHPRQLSVVNRCPADALPTGGSELLLSVPNLDDPAADASAKGPQLAPAKPQPQPTEKAPEKNPETPPVVKVEAAKSEAAKAEATKAPTTASTPKSGTARVIEFGKSTTTSGAKVIELGKSSSTPGVTIKKAEPAKTVEQPASSSAVTRLPSVGPQFDRIPPPETTLSEPIDLEGLPAMRLEEEKPLLSSNEAPAARNLFGYFALAAPPAVVVSEPKVVGESTASDATQHARQGFALLTRNAHAAARAELLLALQAVAQQLDGPSRGGLHAQALDAALIAIEEVDDFASRPAAATDISTVTRGHRTPALRNAPGATVAGAMDRYLAYAQEQLATAAGGQSVGAIALYGLAKLHEAPLSNVKIRESKALMFYQASLAVLPRNSVAANDLGVLLARMNRYADARAFLEYSLALRPQPTAWHNLAVVYQRLGMNDRAQRAERLAQANANRSAPTFTASRSR